MPVGVGLARAAGTAGACPLVLVAGPCAAGGRRGAHGPQAGRRREARGVPALSGATLVSGRAVPAGGLAVAETRHSARCHGPCAGPPRGESRLKSLARSNAVTDRYRAVRHSK